MQLTREGWAKARQFMLRHHLPIGLAVAIAVALAAPHPGKVVGKVQVMGTSAFTGVLVICIFLLSGVGLRGDDIIAAMKAWPGFLVAFIVIMGVSPLLGLAAVAFPWRSEEIGIGLAVFVSVATTLSSGVALTQQAEGNTALALLITASTNCASAFITPAYLSFTLKGAGANVSATLLLGQLAVTLIAPLAVGRLLRAWRRVRSIADANKRWLSFTSSLLLILIAWQSLSDSADRLLQLNGLDLGGAALAGLLFHFLLLGLNYLLAGPFLLNLRAPEFRAVLLLASQKTLPGAVTVISFLDPDNVGKRGLMLVPCVIAHVEQLVIDSLIVSKFASVPVSQVEEEHKHSSVLEDEEEDVRLPEALHDSPSVNGMPPRA